MAGLAARFSPLPQVWNATCLSLREDRCCPSCCSTFFCRSGNGTLSSAGELDTQGPGAALSFVGAERRRRRCPRAGGGCERRGPGWRARLSLRDPLSVTHSPAPCEPRGGAGRRGRSERGSAGRWGDGPATPLPA
jgi:hypothetical protein